MPTFRTRMFHLYFRLVRPMTLGVRVILQNDEGHVFLVRHTYVAGWHLPGGGVEPGQTAEDAVRLELREEGNIELRSRPELFAFYFNRRTSRRDHVALYRVKHWQRVKPFQPNNEIAECGFFPLDRLPDGTTEPTRNRLLEFTGSREIDPYW